MNKAANAILASLLAAGLSSPVPAQDTDTPGDSAAPRTASAQASGIRPAVLEVDRLLIDAKRQLELFLTVGQIVQAVEQIRPFGDTILVLLDESRPMADRWQEVLTAPAGMAVDSIPPEHLPPDPLQDELRLLKDRVEVMNAELAVLHGAPSVPFGSAALPSAVDESENPEPTLQEQIENWQLDAGAVRYAQTGRAGVQPAVWLDAPTGGARLAVGASIRIGGRAVRLDRLERRRDGRIRLRFSVDGKPVHIDW